MSHWEIMARLPVLSTKWVTVFKETVKTPGGVLIPDYYVAERADIAMIAAFSGDSIVLINEYKHGCRDFVWQLPAGIIEPGTEPIVAAARELEEETGMRAENYQFLGSWYISSSFLTNQVFAFTATGAEFWSGQTLEETEDIHVELFSFDQALQMVVNNIIKDAHSCAAILHLAFLKGAFS